MTEEIHFSDPATGQFSPKASSPINIKRVISITIRFWYLLLLGIVLGVMGAYFITRYTTRVYTVSASIIVREGVENAGAEFLYKGNPLVSPYRNFYNELYIMRSYPLLQGVIEGLNFDVIWFREGNIKTVEVYEDYLPKVVVLPGPDGSAPYGNEMTFIAQDQNTFSLEIGGTDDTEGKLYSNLSFNDTLFVHGYSLCFAKKNDIPLLAINKSFTLAFINPYSLAKQYAERLKTSWAEEGASVVNLSIDGTTQTKEIDFLNQFISRYQLYDVEKKNEVATKSIEFLDRQLADIRDSLNYYDKRIATFKQSRFNTNFEAEAQRLLERILELEQKIGQLDLYNNYFNYLEGYLKASNVYDQIVPPSAMGIEDKILTELISQLTEVQFGLRMLGDLQTEANPMVLEHKQRINQLKGDILEGVRSVRKAQQINREYIKKQLDLEEKQLAILPGAEREFFDIKRSYSIRENLYLFLMQKRAEAGISRASTTSDIIVVNPPAQKGGPITPKPIQNYALGFLIGLVLPILGFVLADFFNDRVQSKDDIEQLTDLPVVGGIGHAIAGDNLVVLSKPKSSMAEAFRALRSNLNYFTHGQDKKVILITSSISGEGKTFTTLNLATIMAFSQKRVIIVGADMRKPKLYGDFGLNNDFGLSTYLADLKPLQEVIQKTNIKNLDLISSGPVPPNPSELLMLPALDSMLKQLLKQYDYVLIDSPPMGLVSDAFSLLPHAHHTLFMVRQNYTLRNYLRDFQAIIYQRNISNISILFNDIRKTGLGYGYGRGYGYGYDYGYGYGYGKRKKGTGGYYED